MIRVTIELWPHGDASKKRTLASADIWNDGSGSPWLGSYGFKLFKKNGAVLREGGLGEFRRQDFSVWWLVAAVLHAAFPKPERSFRDTQIRSRVKA